MTLRHYLYFKITDKQDTENNRERIQGAFEKKLFWESVFVETAQSISSRNM